MKIKDLKNLNSVEENKKFFLTKEEPEEKVTEKVTTPSNNIRPPKGMPDGGGYDAQGVYVVRIFPQKKDVEVIKKVCKYRNGIKVSEVFEKDRKKETYEEMRKRHKNA